MIEIKNFMKSRILIALILLLNGCASNKEKLISHADELESHHSFGVCSGYGCKNYQKTGLSDAQWQDIESIFNVNTISAEGEREMIARAIALIEQMVGPKTGTDNDKAQATIINLNTEGQMDCIDEAFNTSTYLYLLRQDGLIKLHTLGKPIRRNFNVLSYPHSTASIHEISTNEHFTVDSWFHQNGALAEIIPAKTWMGPWYPEEKKERYNFSTS
jgi:hypothetical protein